MNYAGLSHPQTRTHRDTVSDTQTTPHSHTVRELERHTNQRFLSSPMNNWCSNIPSKNIFLIHSDVPTKPKNHNILGPLNAKTTRIRKLQSLLYRIVLEFLKLNVSLEIYLVVKTNYREKQCNSYRDFDVVVFLRNLVTSSHQLLFEGFRAKRARM